MKWTNPVGTEHRKRNNAKFSWVEVAGLALLLAIAAVFLFDNLRAKYLWQDEAATAELAMRLMRFGKPLGYDGVNLITMDYVAADEYANLEKCTGAAEPAIQYFIHRGDFRRDTAWTGQPWGSFVIAGVSLKLFGKATIPARAPFAAAAFLTVILLYWFVRQQFRDRLLAWLAAAILVTNVYWVIHSRQCRYYAPSSLFLLLTLIAFARWQRGQRWGATVFVITAWCWFQIDFGTFWPMVGILLLLAVWSAWPHVQHVLIAGVSLGAAVAPWVWYYQLAGRIKSARAPWSARFLGNLFHVNQFLIPLAFIAAAAAFLIWRWRSMDPLERRIIIACIAMPLAALVWVPTVAPFGFYRYVVSLTPVAALCIAWVLTEASAWLTPRHAEEEFRAWVAVSLAVLVAACPLLSNLVSIALTDAVPGAAPIGLILRPEWQALYEDVFAPQPDPNRRTVEALSRIASHGDEILTNYEDIPLMFYTDYHIRGGMSYFRVEDDRRGPPRFLVYRRSFGPDAVFQREVNRYRWRSIPSNIPDVIWGNIPEPELRIAANPASADDALLGENLGPATPATLPDTTMPASYHQKE
jgi:4-amino-4-deoxy-L-arabinose transferase-like glycosyltransferase